MMTSTAEDLVVAAATVLFFVVPVVLGIVVFARGRK